MASLKDTLIQGSARITDTLYANNINIGNALTAKTLTISSTSAEGHINFTRTDNISYLLFPNNSTAGVGIGIAATVASSQLIIQKGKIFPGTTEAVSLGVGSNRWNGVYSTTGNFTGTVEVNTLKITNTSGVAHLTFSRTDNPNYIVVPDEKYLIINNGTAVGTDKASLGIQKTQVYNAYGGSLGTSNYYWGNIYAKGYIYMKGVNQYPLDFFIYNKHGNQVAEMWYDHGAAETVTTGKFGFREYSPASTAAATTTGKHETYYLPTVTTGRSDNATYTIITTKNLSSITSVGTITSGTWQGTAITSTYIGSHNHNASNINAGTLGVARGGTGAGTFTANCVIVGNGTSAMASRGLSVTGAVNGGLITLQPNNTTANLKVTAGGLVGMSGMGVELDATYDNSDGIVFSSPFYTFSHKTSPSASTTAAFINYSGMFELNTSVAQNTHRFLVNGDSAFTGKLAFIGTPAATLTENASIQYINSGLFYRGTILTGTGTAAAGNSTNGYTGALWKFNLSIATPNDGDKITIRVPIASHDYGTYISLDNGTTYRAVGINGGTTRLTGQYPVDSIVTLVYDADGTIASLFPPVTPATSRASSNTTNIPGVGCWRLVNYYDSGNTNDSAGYMRQMQNGAYRKTSAALYRYKILLPHFDGIHAIPANTTNIQNNTDYPFSTAMTTITTAEFDITRPIEYYNSTTTLAADANIDDRYHWFMYSGVDLRYSFNTGTTLTAGKDVYLVATVQAGGLTAKLRNPGATGTNAAATATGANAGPITQVLPTSDDGFIYIKLGNAYSTAGIILTSEHPIYQYKDGALRPFTPIGAYPTGSTSKCMTEAGTWASFTNNAGTVTSITLSEGAGISLSATGAITTRGTRTISISGMNTSTGDTTKFLNQKGDWSTVSTSDEKVKVAARDTTKAYLLASTSATSNGTTAVTDSAVYLGTETGGGHLYATAVHNAVWNDYAEYRRAKQPIAPGRVIIDTDEGAVVLATRRLQPGAQIVSDTWGHIMGETSNAKTPVAVAGRVLVYPYRERSEYHAGMSVCSAPDGTVDIMSDEEIRNFSNCIIGYVSEIPNYETWGSGNVKVDGRIWVRVK